MRNETATKTTTWKVFPHAPWSVWAGDKQIASCRWTDEEGNFSPVCEDQVKAGENARLIAAAPELLDALRKCKAALQDHGHYGDIEIGIAELAIDKAEGRA